MIDTPLEDQLTEPLTSYPMSEDFLANEFVDYLKGWWRYCHALKRWFEWDGNEWQEDRTKKIDSLAVQLTRIAIYYPEAASLTPG